MCNQISKIADISTSFKKTKQNKTKQKINIPNIQNVRHSSEKINNIKKYPK